MSETKKRRITIEVDDRLFSELEEGRERTGLGFPELGRMGLIKVVLELRRTGRIVAEAIPDGELAGV